MMVVAVMDGPVKGFNVKKLV